MTLIQADNYGPWTVSLGSSREPYLQILQSELYAELQRLFSLRGGLVFQGRFDNMLAVTNGISVEDHTEIQERVCQLFPITLSMGVGAGKHPTEAQLNATGALQTKGSSRNEKRRRILAVEGLLESINEGFVQIAHVDVNDVTKLTDSISAYDAYVAMLNVHEALAKEFLQVNSLVFFAGGDNFLVISNGLTEDQHREVLSRVSGEAGLEMKAGIGVARTATEALELASKALDSIRSNRQEMLTTPFLATQLESRL
jgi:GTP cyclohydrolase IIa